MINWYLTALKKYAVFSGRAQPAEFWFFYLFSFIITIGLIVIDIILGLYNEDTGMGFISTIYSLLVIIPGLAVGARRLHDIGKTGWWQLIAIIPIIGTILLIIWWASNGKEENQYGKNPKNINNDIVNTNYIEELEKLVELKDKGILTEEEFEAKKQVLLR